MDNDLKIGICGIACFKCPLYTKKECPGCRPNEFCPLPECSQNKNIDLCFNCLDFPSGLCYQKGALVKPLLIISKENFKDNYH